MARVTDTATLRSADQILRRNQLRAVVSASVGTTIEWYDFFLYGVAAATVFPQKFFPSSDPFIGTMLSFTTFFVGFVARPIGGAIFGHFGDRIGRKKLLVFTMIVMGASTMAVGLTPGYDVIGVWGAVFLTLGRILQGLAIGGQWSGSVLMAAEWTDPKRRGFTTSFALTMHGDPVNAARANAVGTLLAVFCLLVVPWSVVSAWRGRYLFIVSAERALIVCLLTFVVLMLARWGIVLGLMWGRT